MKIQCHYRWYSNGIRYRCDKNAEYIRADITSRANNARCLQHAQQDRARLDGVTLRPLTRRELKQGFIDQAGLR